MRTVWQRVEGQLLQEIRCQVALFVLLQRRVDELYLAANLVMKSHHDYKFNGL